MGRLSTHVLDTVRGRPAVGVGIDLDRIEDGRRRRLGSFTTNADGRTDAPLLAGAALEPGLYELAFHVGAYHAAAGIEGGFLDTVPIRFRVADASGHYHVPLIVTPWSYSTYRGS